jgi:hypothetical protein
MCLVRLRITTKNLSGKSVTKPRFESGISRTPSRRPLLRRLHCHALPSQGWPTAVLPTLRLSILLGPPSRKLASKGVRHLWSPRPIGLLTEACSKSGLPPARIYRPSLSPGFLLPVASSMRSLTRYRCCLGFLTHTLPLPIMSFCLWWVKILVVPSISGHMNYLTSQPDDAITPVAIQPRSCALFVLQCMSSLETQYNVFNYAGNVTSEESLIWRRNWCAEVCN